MHLRVFLTLLTTSLLLNSCFIADEIFIEENEENTELNLQSIAEKNITEKINSLLGEEVYRPYGFGNLYIVEPIEITNLDQLESDLEKNPADSLLAQKIAAEKKRLHEKGIERSAHMNHFFTLTTDSTITVMDAKYSLNDTLGVKRMTAEVLVTIPISYQLPLDYYYHEYTIIIAQTYSEGKRLSKAFYKFFKNKLETYDTVEGKSDFLKHTLEICKLVKIKGQFDQDFIVQNLFKTYISEKRPDIKGYESIEFSDLYETQNNSNNEVLGYYFFHKFIGDYESQRDTNVVLVEFSPYYQVDQIFQLEGSFESYTNKKK